MRITENKTSTDGKYYSSIIITITNNGEENSSPRQVVVTENQKYTFLVKIPPTESQYPLEYNIIKGTVSSIATSQLRPHPRNTIFPSNVGDVAHNRNDNIVINIDTSKQYNCSFTGVDVANIVDIQDINYNYNESDFAKEEIVGKLKEWFSQTNPTETIVPGGENPRD